MSGSKVSGSSEKLVVLPRHVETTRSYPSYNNKPSLPLPLSMDEQDVQFSRRVELSHAVRTHIKDRIDTAKAQTDQLAVLVGIQWPTGGWNFLATNKKIDAFDAVLDACSSSKTKTIERSDLASAMFHSDQAYRHMLGYMNYLDIRREIFYIQHHKATIEIETLPQEEEEEEEAPPAESPMTPNNAVVPLQKKKREKSWFAQVVGNWFRPAPQKHGCVVNVYKIITDFYQTFDKKRQKMRDQAEMLSCSGRPYDHMTESHHDSGSIPPHGSQVVEEKKKKKKKVNASSAKSEEDSSLTFLNPIREEEGEEVVAVKYSPSSSSSIRRTSTGERSDDANAKSESSDSSSSGGDSSSETLSQKDGTFFVGGGPTLKLSPPPTVKARDDASIGIQSPRNNGAVTQQHRRSHSASSSGSSSLIAIKLPIKSGGGGRGSSSKKHVKSKEEQK